MFSRCLHCLKKKVLHPHTLGLQNINIRTLSTAEIATALRPFYFAVHPDLFGRHPEQRTVNEESLKHLSAHFEAMKQRRFPNNTPNVLRFYIRDMSDANNRNSFKLVQVSLGRGLEPKSVIKKLLESCNLSTDYIETIKTVNKPTIPTYYSYDSERDPFGDIDYGSNFNNFEFTFRERSKHDRKNLSFDALRLQIRVNDIISLAPAL